MGLYEVFTDHRPEMTALRHAVYRRWRSSAAVRERTMRLLACQDTSTARLARAFGASAARAAVAQVPRCADPAAWRQAHDVVQALGVRLLWLVRGVRDPRTSNAPAGALPASTLPDRAV